MLSTEFLSLIFNFEINVNNLLSSSHFFNVD